MFENICGINVNGEMLDTNTNFSLFNKDSRLSIIYGRNGSGKSTIANAFKKYIGEEINTIFETQLIDNNNQLIPETDELKKNVFIFDEGFIEDNIRIKQDGLETIVMFGKQVDLETDINIAENEIDIKLDEYKNQKEKCDKYDNSNNILSPNYHWNKIKPLLQGEKNWAGIDKTIKRTKQNTAVKDDFIHSISKLEPTKNRGELEEVFDIKLAEYLYISGDGEKILSPVKISNEIDTNTNTIINLLSEYIEKPTLSDREKIILDLVSEGELNHFVEVKNTFINSNIEFCPYCLQNTSNSYKNELVKSIEAVLNERVENHIDKLEENIYNLILDDFDIYKIIDNSTVSKIGTLISSINNTLIKYNEAIEKKINNVYLPISIDLDFVEEYLELLSEIKKLEKLRLQYNKKFDEVEILKKELLQLNIEIAHYTIKEQYSNYTKQITEKENEYKKLEIIRKEGSELRVKLNTLKQKQKSTHIAVDFINNGLKYVFFSNDRLSITAQDNKYLLFSNGKPVRPQNISCGERNILALCYFFTLLFNNSNETDIYTKESLLIIDDPISSFDFENQVGILSYLKSQILKVVLGNKNSKISILTHDLSTVINLEKMFDEIASTVKVTSSGKIFANFTKKQINYFNITTFEKSDYSDYNKLINIVYDYATFEVIPDNESLTHIDDSVIGNIMRRVLEAFSTFEYRKGIAEISCDEDILNSMGNDKYKSYFENLMYRIILHGESHFGDLAKNPMKVNFLDSISTEEKRRTAKDILCLINILNPLHLNAQFKDNHSKVKVIEEWCKDIKES